MTRETNKYEPWKQATSIILVLSRMVRITTVLILINTYWVADTVFTKILSFFP